jgi:hypothetical protein
MKATSTQEDLSPALFQFKLSYGRVIVHSQTRAPWLMALRTLPLPALANTFTLDDFENFYLIQNDLTEGFKAARDLIQIDVGQQDWRGQFRLAHYACKHCHVFLSLAGWGEVLSVIPLRENGRSVGRCC